MKKAIILSLSLFLMLSLNAQTSKKPLGHDDVLKWNRITESQLANDGSVVVYETQPWKGDTKVFITSSKGKAIASFENGSRINLTADSKYAVFTMQVSSDSIRQLKLKKTKRDDFPKDKLLLFNLSNQHIDTLPDVISHKLPEKWGGWLAYQLDEKPEKKKEKPAEDTAEAKKSEKKGKTLYLRHFESGKKTSFPFVSYYSFVAEKEKLVIVTEGDEAEWEAGIYLFDLKSGSNQMIFGGTGDFKQISVDKEGSKIAFLADLSDQKDQPKDYVLYAWRGSGEATAVLDNTVQGIPHDWEISANGRLYFSENGKRLFLGIAPVPPEEDSTILKEELPVLDVWHWNEPVLQTQQINRRNSTLRKTYLSVLHLDTKGFAQLEQEEFSGISLINQGDADQAIAWSNAPYAVQSMWEGSPSHNDFYLVDLKTGKAKMIKQDYRATPRVSAGGSYLLWYLAEDTTWHTYSLKSGKEFVIARATSIQTANELNDVPNPPGSYGEVGWLPKDEAVLLYDRYDIWQLDPENRRDPINLTENGRSSRINYRLLQLNRESRSFGSPQKALEVDELQYLTGHNELTREDGYYSWSLKKTNTPKELLRGAYKLGTPVKAKDSQEVLFTQETFEVFPDLLVSDLKFKKINRISEVNPQQKNFNWGTVELVTWTSLDGRKLEGTLHKPENFDPNQKYPMIVNFYEKSSQSLFGHRIPERHRSTIDYHYYTSNGYLVFNPDVYYKEGYPGEDAFNCVMPGVTALIEKGFVDEAHIGAQGHSWGGYQVAYLATRTNLFAAIESGAPVVNMFSAYGGIRWGSGLNRSFQYEHTQSRIGKSIWESPLRYLENSPIFTMDKVQTPILIMHNDDDGAVPWYQGIEYFIALRRLGKPAWLLNYNNADHWPTRVEDKHDFQIRLAQFFDHYLKGKPMPEWMEKGIPATEKGINFGY